MKEENIVLEEEEQEVVLSPEELAKKQKKQALLGFIFALVGMLTHLVPVLGIVFSGIGLKNAKASKGVKKQPFKVFRAIAQPVAIVFLILSIIATVVVSLLVLGGAGFGIWYGLKAAGVITALL